ncbi:hypothetical protein [Methylococcus capsulatus]|uniref:hypothetical protein n=1 Tax=Methylococcus capsulatus TaxID=414 RepID=UPI00030E1F2A|nr:hypothetical protein [Methylococcus capsulatus]
MNPPMNGPERAVFRLKLAAAMLLMFGWGSGQAEPEPAAPQTFSPDTASISPAVKQKVLEHMKQTNLERLKGWPGIIFYCPVEEAENPAVKAICTAVNADVGNLMAEHKVPFQIAKSSFDRHFLPHMSGRLLLVVDLAATPAGEQPAAISAEVQGLAHYAHAVNWSSELYPESGGKEKSPLEVPQHVDALLWESNFIFATAGDQSTLVERSKAAIEERVRNFLAEFDRINHKR